MKTAEKQRILLVDDDKGIRKAFGDYLKFSGYDVSVAVNAEDGLAKIPDVNPHLILLDINMPGIGGIGFIRRMIRDDGEQRPRILVFTTRDELSAFFDDVPVDGFVVKPCAQDALLEEVRRILSEGRESEDDRVLVAEDDTDYAGRLTRAFQAAGYQVESAATGPEVLEKAVLFRPNALVLKRVLTGMNGDAVLSVLRTMPGTRQIPVVMYDDAGSVADNPSSPHATDQFLKYRVAHQAGDLVRAVGEFLGNPQQGATDAPGGAGHG